MSALIAVPTVRIRPVAPTDLEALAAFMEAVHPRLTSTPGLATSFYRWKYFDLEGRATGYPQAMLAEDGDGVLGFIGCLPFLLRYAGISYPAAWIADWHLAPRGRGVGLGRALLRQAMDAIPSLACVNGSSQAESVFRTSGFQGWTAARSFSKVVRPLAYEWPRRHGARKPLALSRAVQHWWKGAFADPAADGCEGLALDSGNDDQAPAVLSASRLNGMVRSPEYLAWLARAPVANTRMRRLRHAGVPVGYVFTQRDRDRLGRRRARVLDLVLVSGGPELLSKAYLLVAEELASAGQVDYVEFRTPLAVHEELKVRGLREGVEVRFWLKTAAFSAPATTQWLISLADKDDAFREAGSIP